MVLLSTGGFRYVFCGDFSLHCVGPIVHAKLDVTVCIR